MASLASQANMNFNSGPQKGLVGAQGGAYNGNPLPTMKPQGPTVENAAKHWNVLLNSRIPPAWNVPFGMGALESTYPISTLPFTPEMDQAVSDELGFLQSAILPPPANDDNGIRYTYNINDSAFKTAWLEKMKAMENQTWILWNRNLFDMDNLYERALYWELNPELLKAAEDWIENQVQLQAYYAKMFNKGLPTSQEQLQALYLLDTNRVNMYPGSVAEPSKFYQNQDAQTYFIQQESMGLFSPMRMTGYADKPPALTVPSKKTGTNMLEKSDFYGRNFAEQYALGNYAGGMGGLMTKKPIPAQTNPFLMSSATTAPFVAPNVSGQMEAEYVPYDGTRKARYEQNYDTRFLQYMRPPA